MKKIFLFTILVIFIPFILIINKELPISLKNKYGYNAITRAGKLEVQDIVKGKNKKY